MENKVLKGNLVYLTPMSYDDCEDFLRWRNSDFIKSFFIYRKDITLEEQKKWIREKVETGHVLQYIIWDRNANKKIGCVYIQNIDRESKEAEFGILIGEQEYVGGGRGTESARLLIDYAFEKLNLERIYLRVLKDNDRARRSYEKVGFVLEDADEIISIAGKEETVTFMSIKRAEFYYY